MRLNTLHKDAATAGMGTVYGLFHMQARRQPQAIAVAGAQERLSYETLDQRVQRLSAALTARGLERGDRIALLSENRREYVELQLAAAHAGLIVACLNWRLALPELRHCTELVTPRLAVVSERFRDTLEGIDIDLPVINLDRDYEAMVQAGHASGAPSPAQPEDGLIILYTSGTTGMPKGALISHRAEIARMAVQRMDLGVGRQDGFVAWAPMFHMGSTDQVLAALMSGGTVHVVDGFDARRIVDTMRDYPLGWMLLMPGSIEPVVEILQKENTAVRGIRAVGAMIDLVPRALAIDLVRLTGSRYLNSFGSTETGLPPASSRLMTAADFLKAPCPSTPAR